MATKPVLRDNVFHFVASNVFGTTSSTTSFTLSPLTEDTAADSADTGRLSSLALSAVEARAAVLVADQRTQGGATGYKFGVLAASSKHEEVLREFSRRTHSL